MLEYINGEITSLTPTYAVLDVNGRLRHRCALPHRQR